MCYLTTCKTCKKSTWAGCGQHVDQVLKDIPKDKICTCKSIIGNRYRNYGSIM